jgi:DDE superfamily endonuclease
MPQAVLHSESPRQRNEAVDRDVFGARHWAHVRCREEGGDISAERSQALTQHLAPLTERSLGNGFKELVGGIRCSERFGAGGANDPGAPARLRRRGVPVGYRAARTKPAIALAEIDRVIAAGVRFGCFVADAG